MARKKLTSEEIRDFAELSLEAERIFSTSSLPSNVIPFPRRPSPAMTPEDFGKFDLSAFFDGAAFVQVEGDSLAGEDVLDGDLAAIDFVGVPKVGDVVFFTDDRTLGLYKFSRPCFKISHVIRERR